MNKDSFRVAVLEAMLASQAEPDMAKVTIKVNTIYVLLDVIERLNLELKHEFKTQGVFKHKLKQVMNTIEFNCRYLTRYVTESIDGFDRQDSYGDMTDYIDEIVRSAILLGEDEDRTRAIALIRNLVFETSLKYRKNPERYGIKASELHQEQ